MSRTAILTRPGRGDDVERRTRAASLRETLAVLDRLRSLISAGLPPGDALRLGAAAGGAEAAFLTRAAKAVERGASVSKALARAGVALENPDLALLVAGEASGTLGTAIELLCRRFADRKAARERVVRALAYPIALLAITVAVVVAMTTLVLPSFVSLYAGADTQMPTTTRALLAFGAAVKRYGAALGVASCLAAMGVRLLHRHSPVLRAGFDRLITLLPLVGGLVRARTRAEFYATVSSLLRAGVDLEAAMQSATATVPNTELRARARAMTRALRRGSPLSTAVARSGFDPARRDTAMLRIGEAIGDYPGTCERIAGLELEDYGRALDTIARVVEPAVLLVMAAAVSAAALAIYQPVLGSAALLMGGSS
jgi:general secretion pathway protein F